MVRNALGKSCLLFGSIFFPSNDLREIFSKHFYFITLCLTNEIRQNIWLCWTHIPSKSPNLGSLCLGLVSTRGNTNALYYSGFIIIPFCSIEAHPNLKYRESNHGMGKKFKCFLCAMLPFFNQDIFENSFIEECAMPKKNLMIILQPIFDE